MVNIQKGEKNGYGKEYKNEKLIFEGEYICGIKWKGKYEKYQKRKKNNKLIFKGEYKYGKIWNGIGYNINGKKDYDMKNGSGKKKYI